MAGQRGPASGPPLDQVVRPRRSQLAAHERIVERLGRLRRGFALIGDVKPAISGRAGRWATGGPPRVDWRSARGGPPRRDGRGRPRTTFLVGDGAALKRRRSSSLPGQLAGERAPTGGRTARHSTCWRARRSGRCGGTGPPVPRSRRRGCCPTPRRRRNASTRRPCVGRDSEAGGGRLRRRRLPVRCRRRRICAWLHRIGSVPQRRL